MDKTLSDDLHEAALGLTEKISFNDTTSGLHSFLRITFVECSSIVWDAYFKKYKYGGYVLEVMPTNKNQSVETYTDNEEMCSYYKLSDALCEYIDSLNLEQTLRQS